jgi:UDP-N-acetylglucosamine 2-epimerase (non-hydrolysing)
VAGARPNFMKVAPIMRAVEDYNRLHKEIICTSFIHTGQHYDANMSDSFFRDLQLPEPDIHLGVGSGSHAEQTAKVMVAFEKVLLKERPDIVVVVGDVNSTLACTLVAVKLHIPVAHVESGFRSFDRQMPEEINRIVADVLSSYLFTATPECDENLRKEGVAQDRIFLVGDIMVDSLMKNLDVARERNILDRLGLKSGSPDGKKHPPAPYALLTLHRPANVDRKESFIRIIQGLIEASKKIPIVFPIHPRTRKQVIAFGLESNFEFYPTPDLKPEDYKSGNALKRKIHCIDPVGYLDFLNLMTQAKVVLTDSGGIQVETMVLDVPCITLRDTTERSFTLTEGMNVLVNDDPERIVSEVMRVLDGPVRHSVMSHLYDGHTAERIVKILAEKLNHGS